MTRRLQTAEVQLLTTRGSDIVLGIVSMSAFAERLTTEQLTKNKHSHSCTVTFMLVPLYHHRLACALEAYTCDCCASTTIKRQTYNSFISR